MSRLFAVREQEQWKIKSVVDGVDEQRRKDLARIARTLEYNEVVSIIIGIKNGDGELHNAKILLRRVKDDESGKVGSEMVVQELMI